MSEDEQLKLELSTVLEEYKTLKAEIMANLDSGRQVANLTLTSVGILIAAAPIIIQSQATIIFLVAPLLFYVLAWSQLRYTYLVLDMGNYLRDVVVPHVHQLLKQNQTVDRDIAYILSWELPGKGPSRLRRTKLLRCLFLPIAGANFAIPLLAAALSMGTFLILAFQNTQTISGVEWLLIAVDVAAFIYSAYWGLEAERGR